MKAKHIPILVITLIGLSCLCSGTLVRAGEEEDPQEQIARLEEKVASLEVELENAQKKSQTWKNMYYSLKEEYDRLTGATQSGDASEETTAKAKALQTALSLLSANPYSKEGLITQLKLSGLSEEDALFGANSCGADWTEQAARKGRAFLASSSFSLDGLVSQLVLAGFTSEEASEGARRAYSTTAEDSDITYSMENAVKEATSYLTGGNYYSREGMLKKLKGAGYTEEEAIYAADNCGADWMDQARLQAAFYLRYQNLSHDELIQLLLEQGFTPEEAEFGFDQNGL